MKAAWTVGYDFERGHRRTIHLQIKIVAILIMYVSFIPMFIYRICGYVHRLAAHRTQF